MINISIPDNNLQEREYVIYYVFKYKLDIDYKLVPGKSKNYEIEFPNHTKLIFEDHFFNLYPKTHSYRSLSHLPEKIQYANLPQYDIEKLPIIFGENKIRHETNQIIIKFDIFADIFFYLTRWEENITKLRDKLERPLENELYIIKHKTYEVPVVEIFTAFIVNIIKNADYKLHKYLKEYKITPTHDVDYVKKWQSNFAFFKELGGDIFKRKNLERAQFNFTIWRNYNLKNKNSFDTISELIYKANSKNLRAVFYFMAGGKTKWDSYDSTNDSQIKKWSDKICKNGHLVGIHPSVLTSKDKELLESEIMNLNKITNIKIDTSRQHFLRLSIPQSWQILNKNKIKFDSSCGFSSFMGFRCGTSNPFPVFDIKNRIMLDLIEKPLIVMDSAVCEHMKITEEEAIREIKKLKTQIKKYGGEFVFLLHNSSINSYEYRKYRNFIEELYN